MKKSNHVYLGIIPARGGSKAIPRKNMVLLARKPLLRYTFEAVKKSRLLDRTILTTDDKKIAEFGKKEGIEVPFIRPKVLSGDKAILEDVIKHALNHFRKEESYVPYAVVLLQPTSPLRTGSHIDEAIRLFEKNKVDSLVSVSCPMEHPCDMARFKHGRITLLSEELRLKKGEQRQQYPKYYFINGAIYIFKVNVFFECRSRFGRNVMPYIMPKLYSIDIDTLEELKIAEAILRIES